MSDQDKPFKAIGKDFPSIDQLCKSGLSTKDGSDFAKVASGVHSVLSNWQELLVDSTSQDKTASTYKNYNNTELSCTENEYTKDFDILERDRLDALDTLKTKDAAYLLTSLILAGSIAPDAMKSIDNEAYQILKKYLNTCLDSSSPAMILNDPRKASMALLVWNSIANMHLEAIEVEILKSQLMRKEAGFKANAEIAKNFQSELDAIKAGKEMPAKQSGGGPKKRRVRRRSASKKKRRRSKSKVSRKKSAGRKKRS